MKFENLTNGEYVIKLSVKAAADTLVSAVTNHRRFLMYNFPMKKGEAFSGSFAAALKDADFQKQPAYRDSSVEVLVSGDCEFTAEIEKTELPVIYCLGDSTVCDQAAGGKTALDCCCGWGQTLGLFLKDKFAVSNHAEQGTHTADCLGCHLVPVLRQIKKGDFVIAQFGHNDQKQEHLKPFGGYRENLIKIGKAVKDAGAELVICSPINRLIYVDGKLNGYLDDWAAAAKSAAQELGAGFVDLHAFTSETYLRLGEKAEELFYHSPSGLDRTHPCDKGGILIGRRAAKFFTDCRCE